MKQELPALLWRSDRSQPADHFTWLFSLNMLNELEGAGLLGLPYAMRLSGWWALACMALAGNAVIVIDSFVLSQLQIKQVFEVLMTS